MVTEENHFGAGAGSIKARVLGITVNCQHQTYLSIQSYHHGQHGGASMGMANAKDREDMGHTL